LEFPGAYIFPGLQDAHVHLSGLGASLETVDLRGSRSLEEVVSRLRQRAIKIPKGSWIFGRGWDQTLWDPPEMPSHSLLSQAFPENPVVLRRVGGHAVLLNQRALSLAGIGAKTKEPQGGKIFRNTSGQPTGVLLDRAMDMVSSVIPKGEGVSLKRQLLAAQEHCLKLGITRVHEAGASRLELDILRSLVRSGEWKLGVYGMFSMPPKGAPLPKPFDPGPRAKIRFRALKLYADGALGSRGAALLEPYSDRPGTRGLLVTSIPILRTWIKKCANAGLQPCVHAIGDRANRMVLDLYQNHLSPSQRAQLRPRVEHAQIISPKDLPRFSELGVVASMQPTHLTTDMRWAELRLGKQRLEGAYAFGTLMRMGARVCFGSDAPVEPVSPFRGLFAAITTISPDEPLSSPLKEEQALSPRNALNGFTTQVSFAAGEEAVRGQIMQDQEADLLVVDRNLLSVPPEALLKTQVLATFVSGELVFRRK
jgi:predicted amidohydrolase YtcJ